jgi:hypothetical protein
MVIANPQSRRLSDKPLPTHIAIHNCSAWPLWVEYLFEPKSLSENLVGQSVLHLKTIALSVCRDTPKWWHPTSLRCFFESFLNCRVWLSLRAWDEVSNRSNPNDAGACKSHPGCKPRRFPSLGSVGYLCRTMSRSGRKDLGRHQFSHRTAHTCILAILPAYRWEVRLLELWYRLYCILLSIFESFDDSNWSILQLPDRLNPAWPTQQLVFVLSNVCPFLSLPMIIVALWCDDSVNIRTSSIRPNENYPAKNYYSHSIYSLSSGSSEKFSYSQYLIKISKSFISTIPLPRDIGPMSLRELSIPSYQSWWVNPQYL